MKTLFCLVLLIVAVVNAAFAQGKSGDRVAAQIRIAYYATIKYPGLQLGAELLPRYTTVVNSDSADSRHVRYKALTLNYTFYHHATFHANHLVTAGYVWRRQRPQWFADFEPQVGVSRTVVSGTTYTVGDDGTVSRKRNAGDFFLASSFALSFGRQCVVGKLKFSVYVRPSVLVLFPYNDFLYARPAVQVGVMAPLFTQFTTRAAFQNRIRNH